MTTTRDSFVDRANRDVGTAKAAAVGSGARHLIDKRAAAVDAYPAMDAMRDRARAIRLHTLAHLDTYLDQFADAVEALGATSSSQQTQTKRIATSGRSRGTPARI